MEVRFGTTVTEIVNDPDGVTAHLTDGAELTLDLLVGADGLHSAVRKMIFGPEENYRLDFGAAVASFELESAPEGLSADRTISLALVGRGAGVYALREGRMAAFFSFASSQLDADFEAGAVPTLRHVYGDLGWVLPTLLEKAAESKSIYFDRISQIRMDRWSKGRVVLMGDAAWCVSLFAGYGSSLGVGGADLLGDMLDSHRDIPTALQDWESQLRPEVIKKQRVGARSRGLFIATSPAALVVRSLTFRLMGSRAGTALMRRFLGIGGATAAAKALR